jgi:Na+/H+-translocating membrane pyrophosphatase
LVGFLFGPAAIIEMIAGAIITGLLLGLFRGNVGNTWDNAKKYVESGELRQSARAKGAQPMPLQ